VSTAAAIIVALAVFCASLHLLRRLGFVLPIGAWSFAGGAGATPTSASPPETKREPAAGVHVDLASNFDLGPTYAEEALQREKTAREREEAVLRQLFEQNLRLREEIGDLAEPGEPIVSAGNNGVSEMTLAP
jgi:hypothetical protein